MCDETYEDQINTNYEDQINTNSCFDINCSCTLTSREWSYE